MNDGGLHLNEVEVTPLGETQAEIGMAEGEANFGGQIGEGLEPSEPPIVGSLAMRRRGRPIAPDQRLGSKHFWQWLVSPPQDASCSRGKEPRWQSGRSQLREGREVTLRFPD